MKTTKPLDGTTIVVTASRRAAELAGLVANLGGSPYIVPTVGISPIESDDSVSREIESFLKSIIQDGADYAVFMTGPGVQILMSAAKRLVLDEKFVKTLNASTTKVVARSAKPKAALTRFGVKVDAALSGEQATADGVLRLLKQSGLKGKAVAILWHGSSSDSMRNQLTAQGARRVVECSTYVYSRRLDDLGAKVLKSMGFNYVAPSKENIVRLVHEIVNNKRIIDAITFTSPPAARNFFEIAGESGMGDALRRALIDRICVTVVGPSTKVAVEEYGVRIDVIPKIPAMGAMVTALAERRARKA